MASERKLNFLLLLPLWILLLFNTVNCKDFCLTEQTNDAEGGVSCPYWALALNYTELMRVKELLMFTFCDGSQLMYQRLLVSTGSVLEVFDQTSYYDMKCSDLINSISGLLHWAPIKFARQYFNLFEYSNTKLLARITNGTETNIKIAYVQDYSNTYKMKLTGTEVETEVLILRKPSLYKLKDIDSTTSSEFLSAQEIVDLGTFSFYNPTESFQEINFQINITDNLLLTTRHSNGDYFFYSDANLQLKERNNITWEGVAQYKYNEWDSWDWNSKDIELKTKNLQKISLNTALPPKTSITGRIFATLVLTDNSFTAEVGIDGEETIETLGKLIQVRVRKYEKTELRLENIKMSSHERGIFFASYLACLVGLASALVMGFAVFLICLVAQKKDKECICSRINCSMNLTRKRQFIADKSRSLGKVLGELGHACGNICNCIYTEVSPQRESFTPRQNA